MCFMHTFKNMFCCSVSLCIHYAWLLCKLHVNNGELVVGLDSIQVPNGFWKHMGVRHSPKQLLINFSAVALAKPGSISA